jgi:hypothetical protein
VATRLTRHLVWVPPAAAPPASAAAKMRAAGAAPSLTALDTVREQPPSQEQANLDFFTEPRERAVYLLHIGAEVEHALMVQYLYAAYSLGGPQLTDPEHQRLAQAWRATILEIAREEMGHLATVENLLTLIGGPLSFEREDYPIPTDLYPIPFELERLTKKSLGKYVLLEMPNEETIAALGLEEEMEEIRKYVEAEDDVTVNRVGIIYDAVAALFTPPEMPKDPKPAPPSFISSSDIQAESLRFQVSPSEWGLGYHEILIETANDRTSALNAIKLISVQGEGSTIGDYEKSHFGKFLNIYRQFPGEGDWEPARNVAKNPTTDQDAPLDRRITNRVALLWAGLLNLRYRMLLMYLSHAFRIEAPLKASGRTPRGLLLSWTFGEMYNLRSITEILMALPLHEVGDEELLAGPPFEMPYSLALAAHDANRWHMHRDLLQASQQYVNALRAASGGRYENYLKGLHSANESALAQVLTLIGG